MVIAETPRLLLRGFSSDGVGARSEILGDPIAFQKRVLPALRK